MAVRIRLARLISLTILLGASLGACTAQAGGEWTAFRNRFMTPEGRIVDTGNGGISHSEGQGYGMVLAAANNDRSAFETLWRWTQETLERKDVALFSWRYDPSAKDKVSDTNDAADGDILIAWGLLLASQKWHDPAYAQSSQQIRAAIANHLVRQQAGLTILMPALEGYRHGDSVVINPSYLIAPALEAFAQADPQGPWHALLSDGYRFLRKARFGKWDLTPNWVSIGKHGNVAPAKGYAPRFGYDAIRIPLYLLWAHAPPDLLAPFADYWRESLHAGKGEPAWINVGTGETASYQASAGAKAVAAVTMGIPMPTYPVAEPYYSSVLWQLAALAAVGNSQP